MTEPDNNFPEEAIFHGIPASPGVAHGLVFKFSHGDIEIPSYEVPLESVDTEVQRFDEALSKTRCQIREIRNEVAANLGDDEARIFDAHIMVLEDQAFIDDVVAEIRECEVNVERCVHRVSRRYLDIFAKIEDSYLKERATDIADVTGRLLRNLLGLTGSGTAFLNEARILVADDLTPSDSAGLDTSKVLGIATDSGGRTSHAVIMARANAIPAVVGLQNLLDSLEDGADLLIDGFDGTVVVNPSEQTLFRYGKISKRREKIADIADSLTDRPAITADGKKVVMFANVETFDEVKRSLELGADGVGLFRTEGVFLRNNKFPTEEEQFQEYRQAVELLAPRPVTLRTLDVGGDKVLASSSSREANPFMGLRAIRYCLRNENVFRSQLKAILRASAFGQVRLMYPLVTSVEELLHANHLLGECKKELESQNVNFDSELPVGVMIETPSAAAICDLLAEHCSFFSIGTNDLVQYMLAVDRINNDIAYLYEPCHPAVLRALQRVIQVAREKGISVGVCGEIAGDPTFLPVLIGMGVEELSVAPPLIPEVKYVLSRTSTKDSEILLDDVLSCDQSNGVHDCLKAFLRSTMASEG
ncbi:MAG: phosphoenolpyruvate--protein phosphotransferase [Opitutae bacterium]|nr:phosphoenolpyruvate--protein phosphotransferase [Opitutae bacterium]|tara:strand:+ start:120 stop:1886 length:1767 start_codon:yes stop_codon:yes gene_type:complete